MKKANIIIKIKGILIILVGVLLAAAGVWLYSKIWGINLLFTDSWLGKIARFYWIFLIAAVVVVAIGVRKFKKRITVEAEPETGAEAGKPKDEETVQEAVADASEKKEGQTDQMQPQETEPQAEEKAPKKSLMRKKTGSTCPNCNKPIGKGNKFCTSCGHKLV